MQKATVIRIAKAVGPWIPALLLVPIFIPSAWDKFSDAGGWAHAFRVWGYPDWFRVLIGVIELSAVTLLVLGRTAALGAILIIVVMLGAMGTHIAVGDPGGVTHEVVPLTLASIVLFLRRRQLGDLVRRLGAGNVRALAGRAT